MIINRKHHHGKEKVKENTQAKEREHLDGENNTRIHATKPTNCECSAAWQDSATRYQETKVNKPSLERVVDAKDWVDNGSKL